MRMNAGRRLLVLAVCLGALSACSKSSAERVCDPGATQHCACVSSAEGVQACADDGTRWEVCACPNGDGGVGPDAPVGDAPAADDGGVPDATSDACGAGAATVTVAQIAQGQIADGTVVQLVGVVATSQQFLSRKSGTTGSCEWGLFVSAPSVVTATAYSGLYVSGYGYNAEIPDGGTAANCPELGRTATGSPIPEDTQPGDALTIAGKVYSYLPSGCSDPATSQVPQWRLTNVCPVQKTGTAAVPSPVHISSSDVAKLASPSDNSLHAQWSGARVQLDSVTAAYPAIPVACPMTGYNYVDTSGSLTLTSGLPVGNKVYRRPIGGQTDVCQSTPVFCGGNTSGLSLSVVQGLHHLDNCVWALLPNDKCADFTPKAEGCGSTNCAPY
jgi:hypothetical protein